jgi:uncharacterized protein YceK
VNRFFVVFAALAAISLVGCASVEQQQSAESKADKTYTTGSRIPVRDGIGSASVKSIDNKEATDAIMQRGGVIGSGKTGGGM